MNISCKWLKRFIEFSQTPKELAAVLTSVGLECDTVEEIETIRGGLRGLKIGKVLTCVDHPDSDHLHVTTVDVGGESPLQIVCGAPNVAAGQTVVVATIGTELYDGDKKITIKKGKMRGVESYGMICAEDETGLGNGHDGIMVLPEGIAPGTDAATYFNVESDYALEVELTPNRVDAASHYGVARDLKAYEHCRIFQGLRAGDYPEISLPDVSSFTVDCAEGGIPVEVKDPDCCPRYSGITIRGVKVGQSPEWLRNLLTAAGSRPINNIVDITNFILLGIGQPLHCFDLAKVKGGRIVVRKCAEGTPFTTLDGVEHKLDARDLMICNAEEPMAIAGVYGGLDSGVTEETTDVFIESAWFNPTSVRKTARRQGLSTDASFRYERGTDPDITVYAAKLAAILIKELAGGDVCGEIVDKYPNPVERVAMDFSLDYCDSLIGKKLEPALVKCILRALDFTVDETGDPRVLRLTVPTYRVDVTRPCDVVEEILRIYGYNNVEIPVSSHVCISAPTPTDYSVKMQRLVSEQLSALGFNEIMNNSLTSVNYYDNNEKYPLEHCVRLLNPLSSELGVMRQTLLYGGLDSLSHNINRKAPNLKFYEFGNVETMDPSKEITAEHPLAPFSEKKMLGLWLTGDFTTASWNVKAAEATVYDLRAIVENILLRFGITPSAIKMTQTSDSVLATKLVIETRSGRLLGEIGIVANKTLKMFDISQGVVYADLDWEALCKAGYNNDVTYSDLPKTQPVKRDLALLLDADIKYARVEETIRKAERKLLRDVRLFDVYEGKNLPEGKKSYAVSMTIQDYDKTLNDRQIEAIMEKITKALRKELGAELR